MARGTKYHPEIRGLREIGASRQVRQLSLDGARRVAEHAQRDNPRGSYSVSPATVVTGWDHERRAGAQVVEERPGQGPQRRSLARAAQEARA